MSIGTYGAATYGAATYGGLEVRSWPSWLVVVRNPDGTWRDVTCDVRRIAVRAGRSSYVDAFAASELELELDNAAGVYSPWPPDSVWLQPSGFVTGVGIGVASTLAGGLVWRFTGTTDAVVDSWPGTVDAATVVRASDGLKNLARHNGGARAAVGAGELSGARVNRLLDDAGWSTTARAVDAGTVTLQGTTLDGATVDLLRQVGESEWGWLYVDGAGRVMFLQRDAAQTRPNMTTVQYVFADTDAIAGACYGEATQLAADEAHVINTATVTPPGHTASSYTDTASVGWFGPRTWTRTDLPLALDVDAAQLAQLVVNSYKAADRRVDAVTIDGANRPDNWPAAHGTKITDRIRFVRTLPSGHQIDAELLVQGRTDDVVPAGADGRLAEWTVTLQTASASSLANLGRWDVSLWDTGIWGV